MGTKYKVKKGDTLSKIAKSYNTSVTAIQKANSKLIKNVNRISVGWVLEIPTPTQKKQNKHKQLITAVEKCVEVVEKLPEFEKVCELLNE